jgi:hypothetical protein
MTMREDETTYEIKGIVGGPAGDPLRGARVVVWWQQIRERLELAAGETSEDGRYHLRYHVPEEAPRPVLVVVEALSELFESRIFSPPTEAAPRLEIDLAFEPRDDSTWAQLVRSIEPLLDGLALDELVEGDTHQDLTFLFRELGESTETLMQVALSARLARAYDLPAPVFFAFLDQRVPASLPFPLLDASQGFTLVESLVQNIASLVFALPADVQQSTLTAAIALDLIGPQFTPRIPELMAELQARRTTDLLNQPYVVGNTTLSQLLDVVSLTSAKQQVFAGLLAANSASMDDFWDTLAAGQSGLTSDEASSVERVLSIGALAKNYVPLVQALEADFASGAYGSFSQLAQLSLADWTKLVTKTGAPPGVDPTGTDTAEEVFAKVVYARATRAFPTVALASRIASTSLVPEQQREPVERFFANNPELELVGANLASFLAGKGAAAFTGIPRKEQATVTAAVRGFQRVLRVSSNPDVAQTILGAGITSATQIANLGRQQFFVLATDAGLTKVDANRAYEAAAFRYANVVSTYMQLNNDAVGVLPKMIGNVGDWEKPVQEAVQRDQSLATLFGSQDYCAIEDCTSVLGPAAYLCDLLLWLRNHPQGGHTALDVLDARRPDIRNLLLNCPNSDTELPYVDLVNELLADTIAPPTDPSSTINPPWKQTSESATADQLRAAPEYFNQDAYVALFGASYPQTLPYSTGLDELRTYLQQWNMPLWQLRQGLLPLAGGSVAEQAAVAAERLGMNVHAQNIVTIPNAVTPAVAWNTSDFSATAPNGLAYVPAFLHASSLTYDGLLALLDTSWVQGGLGIELVGLNDSCDTTQMTLSPAPLDTGFLDRAHRFLRLWLATGYEMWELDLLLNAPSVGNGTLDESALVALQAFWQLQTASRLEVVQLLALYEDVDVADHLDVDGTTTTSLYSQVFLNPTTTWAAPDPDLVSLPAGGPIGDPTLADHVKAIQPALGVSATDVATLFSLTDGTLTLANLSLIYRVGLLATAAKLTIPSLFSMAALITPTAATPADALAPLLPSPAATLEFLAQATAIQQSALSLDALTYLLTPPTTTAFAATTTLASAIAATQTTITVASDAGFPAPSFYVGIGAEILQVTAVGGIGNTTWTVLRGQGGTTAASASNGAAVAPASNGGWATKAQMAPADIATALAGVQQAIVTLLAASTTLTAPVAPGDPTIAVASAAGFPAAPFYVYLGAEILQVTAIGGTGGTQWTVLRGQLGTTAAAAPSGASLTPTSGDVDGAVVAAVAAGAHTPTGAPLANDVTALILGSVDLPGSTKTLLATLEDPALVAPTGTITIGGTPTAGDTLATVITDVGGATVTVDYTLVPADAGDVNATALHFADAINASPAVTGPTPFLAPATASGAVVTVTALTPAAPGASVTCTSSAGPGGAGHVAVSPDVTALNNVPTPTAAAFPDQFTAIQLVDKLGVLVRGLKLVATDLQWLLENAAVYGGTDLTALPVLATQPALPIAPLLETLLLVKQARAYTAAPVTAPVQTLYDLVGGVGTVPIATEGDAQVALATITGWPVADIEAFARALELAFPASYTDPDAYAALRNLELMSAAVDSSGPVVPPTTTTLTAAIDGVQTTIDVASAIGFPAPTFYVSIGTEILLVTAFGGGDNTTWTVARGQQGTTAAPAASGAAVTPTYGAQIVSWGTVPTDEVGAEALAASALGVLKAQQTTEEGWLALAPTMMDPVRDRRSAALRAYLAAQRDGSGNLVYGDDDALFDFFLIDVDMSSCQLTSRVVQAYIAVQIFVERCRMNLETTMWNSSAKGVVVDLSADDTWNQWEWMQRYRIWEANREVFLYPENWLIESQRPNRTEIYETFEQEVQQGDSTADYLETVVLNYIDRLDGLSHLLVTGTCEDPATGTIYVVARTVTDPPTFYSRSYADGAWSGWTQIPLDIKAHQAIPAVYRGRECVFWIEVKAQNEPVQSNPPAQPNSSAQSQNVNRYVSIGVNFSIYRNGSWTPVQSAKGKLFDKPIFDSSAQAGDVKSIEALYTLKVQTQPATPGLGTALYLDVFRRGTFTVKNMYNEPNDPLNFQVTDGDHSVAVHLGRAVFDGRFSDLELNNFEIPGVYPDNFQQDVFFALGRPLLTHAKQVYGPDAQPLIPLTSPDPNLTGESSMLPIAGALAAFPSATGGAKQTIQLSFPTILGPLLTSVTLPVRVVGPSSDLTLDPMNYFFFQDNRRAYYVETQKDYRIEQGRTVGARLTPSAPSDPHTVPYQMVYVFHPFYHPFTRLAWNQLGAGGFDLLYDPELQQAPDAIDPSYPDVFSFANEYQPTWRVSWDLADVTTRLAAHISPSQTSLTVTNAVWVPLPPFFVTIGSEQLKVTAVGGTNRMSWTVQRGQSGTGAAAASSGATVTPLPQSQDRQFLDFSTSAPFSVYNWELFYHVPKYVADLLSQNQQFEDAQTWYRYIFDPTHQGPDPVPERFWIPKPLRGLTSADILSEQIEKLLEDVNAGDPDAVAQVTAWRNDPFNPFVLADLRPVAYMKSTVMSYLDNLIAWADNLFASESREALSEATLIYVIASEILGPTPEAVTPPPHADMSYDQLEPLLDAFANAMVEIENVLGGTGNVIATAPVLTSTGNIPTPQTFYFKIPPNDQLLGYWTTVADRLYKLRHCQSITGAPLELALFDAPIDPGLLIAARAAGVDLSSVLTALNAPLPNYRFTSLYPQALDFVNAVRAYGTSLQAALEKVDAGALALLQQTTQQQLLTDGDDVLQLQVQQAQKNIDGLNEAYNLAQQRYNFNNGQDPANIAEYTGITMHTASAVLKAISAATTVTGGVAAIAPDFTAGAAGFGGSPVATATDGGTHAARTGHMAGTALSILSDILEIGAGLSNTIGSWQHRKDNWNEAATEAKIQMDQTNDQIDGANFALEVAQRNVDLHQEQIDNIQKQIDFLNDKFTSNSLYDWMVGSLSATYFQSYQLAYQLCKQVERCYRFELGLQNASFIQFGYWDSLHKGLLAGETLNHDLRRMQSSYLQQNARRYELSRYVSLGALDPTALQSLLVNGSCDFTLPESLFDLDYPGHFNRRLTRVSLTVVYPNPGKFDNVKATLTLVSNQVRIKTDTTSGYEEGPIGSDPRFVYTYAANSQKIAMGNAQDDPGLFITAIASNIADQRYLPFENAGAISSWHLEMPQASNEVDLSTVGDVVMHLYYTALDGGADLQGDVEASNLANLPTSGVKVFSAQNDFAAPAASVANPFPVTPWTAFLTAGATQKLTLAISPTKFPPWTRGKTIAVTGITVLAIAWEPGNFVLVPQAPLPTTPVTLTPVAGATEPNICGGTIATPPGTPLGTWTFELQQQGASDFQSLTKNLIGDVVLLIEYDAS